jgi:rhodanese-related sulfurtransferase
MPQQVDREGVQRLLAEGAQILDVLPPEDYQAQHLPGAINIPLKRLDRQSTARLDRNRPVIVYCADFQ